MNRDEEVRNCGGSKKGPTHSQNLKRALLPPQAHRSCLVSVPHFQMEEAFASPVWDEVWQGIAHGALP